MVDFAKMLSPIRDTEDYTQWACTLDSAGQDSSAARERMKAMKGSLMVEGMMVAVITAGTVADRVKKWIFYGKFPVNVQLMPEGELTPEEIELFARRIDDHKFILLFHGVLGLVTEAAELMASVREYMKYGLPIDPIHIQEESGDIFWYQALLQKWLGLSGFMPTLRANHKKLVSRYGKTWTKDAALNRDLEAEKDALGTDLDIDGDFNTLSSIVAQFELCGYQDEQAHELIYNSAFQSLKAMVEGRKPVRVGGSNE